MKKNFFVVDYEFTFYKKPIGRPNDFFSEIIEIGAVTLDSESLELSKGFQDFVYPKFFPKQAKDAYEFCMIKESDIEKAISFNEMIDEMLTEYIPGKTWFVTWGDADYNVVNEGCIRHEIENPVLKSDCLDLAHAYKLMNGDDYTTSLHNASIEMDVEGDGLWHTAYDDAKNTALILKEMMLDGWTIQEYEEEKEEEQQEKEERHRIREEKRLHH